MQGLGTSPLLLREGARRAGEDKVDQAEPEGEDLVRESRPYPALDRSKRLSRPFDDLPELRELIITFGDSGYGALYHHEVNADGSATNFL